MYTIPIDNEQSVKSIAVCPIANWILISVEGMLSLWTFKPNTSSKKKKDAPKQHSEEQSQQPSSTLPESNEETKQSE